MKYIILKAEDEQRKELFNAGMMLAEEQKERLEAIRARRAEIAEAGQKARVFGNLGEEDEMLAAEEQELNAYLDAAAG